jgi:hypothetical protein
MAADLPASEPMTIVALADLDEDAMEELARITLPAAREHSPGWLSDLDAAREEVAEALAPGKITRPG